MASGPELTASTFAVTLPERLRRGSRARRSCHPRPARGVRGNCSGTILRGPVPAPTPSQTVKKKVLPTPGLALEPDLAAHQLDQPAADGQAQPGAAVLAGGGHVGLGEGLEQFRRLLRGHADAGVAHGELELHLLAGVFEQFDLEPDLALLGELDRVVDEVGEDLAEPERIAEQILRESPSETSARNSRPFSCAFWAVSGGDRADHLVELEIGGLDVELAGLDLREVEDVVDDRQQRGAGVVDLADVVALLRRRAGS